MQILLDNRHLFRLNGVRMALAKCMECGELFEKRRRWQKCCQEACAQKQRNRRRAKKVKKALRELEAASV